MEKSAIDGGSGHFSVLNWCSRRLKRVARSSTSAEVQMMGNGFDGHEFTKLFRIDMLTRKLAGKWISVTLTATCVRRIRLLFPTLEMRTTPLPRQARSGLRMEEKRSAIELLRVKERLPQARVVIRWVDGDRELADCLTKPWLHEQLLTALN